MAESALCTMQSSCSKRQFLHVLAMSFLAALSEESAVCKMLQNLQQTATEVEEYTLCNYTISSFAQ